MFRNFDREKEVKERAKYEEYETGALNVFVRQQREWVLLSPNGGSGQREVRTAEEAKEHMDMASTSHANNRHIGRFIHQWKGPKAV